MRLRDRYPIWLSENYAEIKKAESGQKVPLRPLVQQAHGIFWEGKLKLCLDGRQGRKTLGLEQQNEDTTPNPRDPAGPG